MVAFKSEGTEHFHPTRTKIPKPPPRAGIQDTCYSPTTALQLQRCKVTRNGVREWKSGQKMWRRERRNRSENFPACRRQQQRLLALKSVPSFALQPESLCLLIVSRHVRRQHPRDNSWLFNPSALSRLFDELLSFIHACTFGQNFGRGDEDRLEGQTRTVHS